MIRMIRCAVLVALAPGILLLNTLLLCIFGPVLIGAWACGIKDEDTLGMSFFKEVMLMPWFKIDWTLFFGKREEA